jgi:hypothetical protein
MANDPFGNLRIAAPCPTTWEGMAGDDRVRHCSLCSLNVYNFAEMTRDEVSELLLRTEGRICARLHRRADGTVITRDCPTGLRALRQRASRVAAAVVTAMLTLPAMAFGGTTCSKLKVHGSKVKLKIERLAASQAAAFTCVVRESGTPLPGVTISIRDEATERKAPEFNLVTDVNGSISIPSLRSGLYRVEVTLSGFTSAKMDNLELKAGEATTASVALRVDTAPTITVGGIAQDLISMDASTTTISEELLRRLPF